ncbi:hypothetical protein EON80_10395 [bacterium]|nr:MAG: hypothetical protein EON80_10395 [bacterium]
MLINRRNFLGYMGAAGLTLSLKNVLVESALGATPPKPFSGEAARLTGACMRQFWDDKSHMFRAPILSAETVASDAVHDRGYTLWASLLGLHALVEGEKDNPGQYAPQIAKVFDGLEQYYSPELRAYTAWVQFPGNVDAYYDDNSWVVTILTEAALATKKSDAKRSKQYLTRASIVMADYVVKGFDTSNQPGGVRWGSDPNKPDTSDRGTSATAGTALAALMLARAGVNVSFYTKWGHEVLTWLTTKLLDNDGLIMDALTPPNWEPRRVKWTYNTGVPMRAYVEHYRLTHAPQSLIMATRLAKAALNRDGALFDSKVNDPDKRFYWDGIYFVHYLVDGLLHVAQVTPEPALAASARSEVQRNLRYALDYLKDPADGFYWRNWRLYTIGEAEHSIWERWNEQKIAPAYDPSERSQEEKYKDTPVEDRPRAKTLLANGGAARLFWLASRFPAPKVAAKPKSTR